MKKVLAVVLSAIMLISAVAVNVVAAPQSVTDTVSATFQAYSTGNIYDTLKEVSCDDGIVFRTSGVGSGHVDITGLIEQVAPLETVSSVSVTLEAVDHENFAPRQQDTDEEGVPTGKPIIGLRGVYSNNTDSYDISGINWGVGENPYTMSGNITEGTAAVYIDTSSHGVISQDEPWTFKVTAEVTYTPEGKVRIGDEYFDTLVEAVDAAESGDTIYLLDNVKVHEMVNITVPNVILDLGGFTLTAADDFLYAMDNKNDAHVINISADGVTVRNGTVKATANNKHAINVYQVDGAVLENVTADHTDSTTGAPIVIGGSDVTVKGRLTTITGTNSWYAINVDSYAGMESNITFAQNSTVAFEGVSPLGIYIETNSIADTDDVTVTFDKNVSVIAPEGVSDFTAVATDENATNASVVNPGNAGLKDNGDGTYDVKTATTSSKNKITGCVYLNEDYHALIVNGRFIAQPHVDNGTGFCVACKGAINK